MQFQVIYISLLITPNFITLLHLSQIEMSCLLVSKSIKGIYILPCTLMRIIIEEEYDLGALFHSSPKFSDHINKIAHKANGR